MKSPDCIGKLEKPAGIWAGCSQSVSDEQRNGSGLMGRHMVRMPGSAAAQALAARPTRLSWARGEMGRPK